MAAIYYIHSHELNKDVKLNIEGNVYLKNYGMHSVMMHLTSNKESSTSSKYALILMRDEQVVENVAIGSDDSSETTTDYDPNPIIYKIDGGSDNKFTTLICRNCTFVRNRYVLFDVRYAGITLDDCTITNSRGGQSRSGGYEVAADLFDSSDSYEEGDAGDHRGDDV